MINLGKLYERKRVFGFFVQHLTYPDKLDYHPSVLEELMDSSDPVYVDVKKFWDLMHEFSMEEIEEMYVQTFDFQKKSTLYMTYYRLEEAKERGQMLANIKSVYQTYGLHMAGEELSDYLPLMCEFLYAAEWKGDPRAQESLGLILAVMEDGTYHLQQALKEFNSPYYYVIKALRETFKACIRQEESIHEHG
ncbi:nitrate reductase molybdenum cofactor assembly chaperone [Paenibacillus sp. BR2-3]|uniref:nitrate reductase molybdenum cofactor assembly chaperone n=1 Tax=Paenibacillus sp. BR2-3 TaxID=3048494 RepID=UPI003977C684